MKVSQQNRHDRTAVAIPACTLVAFVWMFVLFARISGNDLPIHGDTMPEGTALLAGLLGPIVMLFGIFLVLRQRRLGSFAVAIGGVLPLPWFFLTESRAYANSWIALNASWSDPDPSRYMHYCELRIISVALLTMTVILAGTRLLPARWQLLRRPLSTLTWPAIGISLIFLVCWFATYAFPYRQPVIVDGAYQELGLLHVEKDGTLFHETRISVYRDGRYFIVRNDRRLFRYSFVETSQEGILRDELRTKLKAILALPELKRTLEAAPRTLRRQRAEGWYTVMGSFMIAAFTTENNTPPPRELPTFLSEIEREVPFSPISRHSVRDICLGFCYDPKAGLGYIAENQRCTESPDGKELCH